MTMPPASWIETLPLEIKGNKACLEHNVQFNFTHIECVENYLFLWSKGYASHILRVHLHTKRIEPIPIPRNIKIESLKILCKHNQHFLCIAENRLKPQLHFVAISDADAIGVFSYQQFSSTIMQIEYSSISSHTLYVLTHHNFNIIGLNDDCNQILYHDRIDVSSQGISSFCLGSPRHFHSKLFDEFNFSYGFGKFAAYLVNRDGEIYVCAPIIPHRFQCTLQFIDALRDDFRAFVDTDDHEQEDDDDDDDDDDLFDVWLNAMWSDAQTPSDDNQLNQLNESVLNQTNFNANESQAYLTYDATQNFIHRHQQLQRTLYKLNIFQSKHVHSKAKPYCSQIVMLDLDAFFFKDRLKKTKPTTFEDYYDGDEDGDDEDEDVHNILPIFVRIWSDHSMDIVCCHRAIHAQWTGIDSQLDMMMMNMMGGGGGGGDSFDAVVICRNVLDFEDNNRNPAGSAAGSPLLENNDFFMLSKTVQNLDELIVAHSFDGLYRLQMPWLNRIAVQISRGLPGYVEFLQHCESQIVPIALQKFYMNSAEDARNAILSDLCLVKNTDYMTHDELVMLDEHLKRIHVFPLHQVDIHRLNASLDIDDCSNSNAMRSTAKGGKQGKDDDQKAAISMVDIDAQFDMTVMKEFKLSADCEEHQIRASLRTLLSSFDVASFPANFSLNDPQSLQWFMTEIKLKMERLFARLEVGNLLMNERRTFIETQMSRFVLPQILLIEDKMQQIRGNTSKLKQKMGAIQNNHQRLGRKIEQLRLKLAENENQYDGQHEQHFASILEDLKREHEAAEYDYEQLSAYEIPEQREQNALKSWNKHNLRYWEQQINASLVTSQDKLKQMMDGLKQLDCR